MGAAADLKPHVVAAAKTLAEAEGFEVAVYNGEIVSEAVDTFLPIIRARAPTQKPALLMLVTPGGEADAAYRLARCFQTTYPDRFTVFVPGWCKSAGTLVAVGANRLVVSDNGELGPLDVQLRKADELIERASGLVIETALDYLEKRVIGMFEKYYLQIIRGSDGMISFKTANSIASKLVTDLYAGVYARIDPIKIGENFREVRVAKDYGKRLELRARNLQSERSLDILIESYYSHSFVIDRDEAESLFRQVYKPSDAVTAFATAVGDLATVIGHKPVFGIPSAVPASDDDGFTEERVS